MLANETFVAPKSNIHVDGRSECKSRPTAWLGNLLYIRYDNSMYSMYTYEQLSLLLHHVVRTYVLTGSTVHTVPVYRLPVRTVYNGSCAVRPKDRGREA
jgi:hypothetical protein